MAETDQSAPRAQEAAAPRGAAHQAETRGSGPLHADLCVVGAGAAGLSVAAAASQLGARVVLVESGRMGGDCLNVGCVPSKALLAAARAAAVGERATALGVRYAPPEIDFAAVMAHVRGVVERLAPLDSEARFRAMGVTLLRGRARFLDRRSLAVEDEAGGQSRVRARRFVLATGSRPRIPEVRGLEGLPYLTNETVFDLEALPQRLLVLGGGAVGCELGQAFRRLGAAVAIVERERLLAGEDPELVEPLRRRLRAEGVELHEGAGVAAAEPVPGGHGLRLRLAGDGGAASLDGSHLLVAAGRRLELDGLALDAAGIETRDGRLVLDRRLRTSNRRVFAAGDAAGGPFLTHLAGHDAGVVVKNALFRLPARREGRAVPRAVYGEPELAQVGLTEAEARAQGQRIEILRSSLFDNDRAHCEGETDALETGGLVKVVVSPGGRVLGAGIAAPHAGELILPWTLAVRRGLRVTAIAEAIVPYPTRSEASRRAAAGYLLPRLVAERTRRLVRLLARLG